MCKINGNNCIGCGLCSEECPAECIKMDSNGTNTIYVIDKDACINCGRCAELCPAACIECD